MDPPVDYRYRNGRRSRSRSRSPSPSSASTRPQQYARGAAPRERPSSHRYQEPGGYYPNHPSSSTQSRRYEDSKTYLDPAEEQRRMKMAKLRAENNAEERRLTDIQEGVATGSKSDDKTTNTTRAKESIVEIQEGELEDYEEDEQMQMLLGFSSGFASTKGQAVEDNHKSASKGTAAKNKARKYRQYMNRKGGFNRPLDAMK